MAAKALIVGGGIGGLTAALCFEAAGWDVQVLEQAAAIAEVGAGLQISPNGVKVLDRLGLGDAVRQIAFEPETLALRDGISGRGIFEFAIKPHMQDRYGAPYLQIHRADLIEVLQTALLERRCDAILTGAKVTSYLQDGSGVAVETEGGDTHSGDILVGADGIHSIIRAQMLGLDRPRFTGNVAWRLVVARKDLDDVDVPQGAVVWAGLRRHAVTYPLRQGELVNFVGIVERDDWRNESWVQPGAREDLAKDFDGWVQLVQRLIERGGTPYRWALFDRAPLARWSDGKVALLGDACHPMLPSLAQGACQAIEDAWILALCVSGAQDTPSALEQYTEQRRARTARIQSAALKNLQLFHATGLRKTLVFNTLRGANRLAPSLLRDKYSWVYQHEVMAKS